MRRLMLLIGFYLMLIGVEHLHAQGPKEESVYETIKRSIEWEQANEDAELAVQEYLPGAIRPDKIDFTQRHVDPILVDHPTIGCEPLEEMENDDEEPDSIDHGTCNQHREDVDVMVKREQKIRGLIREMQAITAGHESVIKASPEAISQKLPAILRLWQSDADLLAVPDADGGGPPGDVDIQTEVLLLLLEQELRSLIRTEDVPDDPDPDPNSNPNPDPDDEPEEDYEFLIAAIHRYRHGVPSGDCDLGNDGRGDGTELQFLEARWCALESLLEDIAESAVDNMGLGSGDDAPRVVIYTIEDLDVDIWVQGDQAGFAWKDHLHPVLPSLNCSKTHSYDQPDTICNSDFWGLTSVILGGTYPEPLEDTLFPDGICSDPLHEKGYLCQGPLLSRCPDPANPDPDAVPLARCNLASLHTHIRWTESGPNICLEGGWRQETHPAEGIDTAGIDPDIAPHSCSNCAVDLYCSNTCAKGGISHAKGPDGVIQTCIGDELGPDTRYLIIHELIHAQQKCNSPPGVDIEFNRISAYGTPGCCAIEFQAYLAQCRAYAQDGILERADLDIETCSSALSNFSCGVGNFCADLAPGLTNEGVLDRITVALQELRGELETDLIDEHGLQEGRHQASEQWPNTCADSIANLDPRAQMILNSLPQICTPECEAKYTNSIGNLLCAIGQCTEQSFEGHRVVPGRMPLLNTEQAFPWDTEMRIPSDEELRGKAFALGASAETPTVPLPHYRPRTLLEKFDKLFCRINALPKRSPPALCRIDPTLQGAAGRQSAVATPLAFWKSFFNEPHLFTSQTDMLRSAVPGVGARVGARLHGQYLSTALKPLNELLKTTNALLQELEDVDFPNQMCPTDASSTL